MIPSRANIPVVSLIVLTALTRLLPHWPNVTPVMAIALCAGAMFSNRLQSLLVPIIAMLISDLSLGFVLGPEYALHATQPWVYACVLATSMLGQSMQNASSLKLVLLGGSLASIGFFVVTNFAVWLHGSFYPATFEGLAACYAAGLAFYRDSGNFLLNGMLSTYAFSAAIVYGSQLLQAKPSHLNR